MSTPTGQAPPRPQVASTSSSGPSPVSTRPLARARRTKARWPSEDPQPGDLLERGGIVWRVIEVDQARVVWLVEGMNERHEATRDRWPRLASSRNVVHRDTKPPNVLPAADTSAIAPQEQPATAETASLATAEPAPGTHRGLKPENAPLSPSARSLLAAILRAPRTADGWVRQAHREDLMRAAGIGSRNTADRASQELADAGALVYVRGSKVPPVAASYRVLDLSQGEPGLSQVLSQGEPVRKSSSSSSPERTSEAPRQPIPARPPGSVEPGLSQGAGSLGQVEFGERTLALLYSALTGAPLCGCTPSRPMVARQQGKGLVWFWGCVLGRGRGCGCTAPMREQPKAQRREREGRRETPPGPRDMSTLSAAEVLQVLAARKKA